MSYDTKFASNIKEACPDMNKDMLEFDEQIKKATLDGGTGLIFVRASSGSVLIYDLTTNTPFMYHPYIKCIFTSALDYKS